MTYKKHRRELEKNSKYWNDRLEFEKELAKETLPKFDTIKEKIDFLQKQDQERRRKTA